MSRENRVRVTGRLTRPPVADHETSGGWIWATEIAVARSSGAVDMLHVMVPEAMMDAAGVELDKLPRVTIEGEIRRHRLQEIRQDGGARWVPAVYVRKISPAGDTPDENAVELWGEIRETPEYRVTPFGRHITGVKLMFRRAFDHWDSVVVLCWGEAAERTKALPVGTGMHIKGRMQSRGYTKLLEDGTYRAMVTYEVSAHDVEVTHHAYGG